MIDDEHGQVGSLLALDCGVVVQDPEGRLLYANELAARTFGYASAEALTATGAEGMHAQFEIFALDGSRFPTEELPGRIAAGGHTPAPVLVRFRLRANGREVQSILSAVPVMKDGRLLAIVNFIRDLTDQARADQQRAFMLRAADAFNSSLDYSETLSTLTRLAVPVLADWCAVDLLEDGEVKRLAVAHVDPAKIAYVEELQRRYPSNKDAPQGMHEIMRTGRSEFIAEIPREMITKAAIDAEHLRLIDALELGSYMGVALRVRGQAIGVITFAMAESHRRYTQQDLEFAQALADRAAVAIDNARLLRDEIARRTAAEDNSHFAELFLGIVGHDLRNPLSGMLTGASYLAKLATSDKQSRVIERILASGARMERMITQLLDLTRLRIGGGLSLDRFPTDAAMICSAAASELSDLEAERNIKLTADGDARGVWDADRLAQVISNLLGNAVQHGPPQHAITLHVDGRDPRQVILTLHNDGQIDPGHLPDLFEPFKTHRRQNARQGLGLGLYISLQIVRAHGGELAVSSTEAEGTTFVITLPRGS